MRWSPIPTNGGRHCRYKLQFWNNSESKARNFHNRGEESFEHEMEHNKPPSHFPQRYRKWEDKKGLANKRAFYGAVYGLSLKLKMETSPTIFLSKKKKHILQKVHSSSMVVAVINFKDCQQHLRNSDTLENQQGGWSCWITHVYCLLLSYY